MHIIRKIIIIHIWRVAKDPTIASTKVDLIAIPFIILPEIGWFIYGNMIVFRITEMTVCISKGFDYAVFFWSVVGLNIYGWFYMVGCLLAVLAALAVFCYFKMNSFDDQPGTST